MHIYPITLLFHQGRGDFANQIGKSLFFQEAQDIASHSRVRPVMVSIASLKRISAAQLAELMLAQQPAASPKLAVVDVRDDGKMRSLLSSFRHTAC